MGYLDKVKTKIVEASEAHAEAKAEREKQRIIQEKEEKKRDVVRISLEAEELGITLSDYIQYLTYKEMTDEQRTISNRLENLEQSLEWLRYELRDND